MWSGGTRARNCYMLWFSTQYIRWFIRRVAVVSPSPACSAAPSVKA